MKQFQNHLNPVPDNSKAARKRFETFRSYFGVVRCSFEGCLVSIFGVWGSFRQVMSELIKIPGKMISNFIQNGAPGKYCAKQFGGVFALLGDSLVTQKLNSDMSLLWKLVIILQIQFQLQLIIHSTLIVCLRKKCD